MSLDTNELNEIIRKMRNEQNRKQAGYNYNSYQPEDRASILDKLINAIDSSPNAVIAMGGNHI